MLILKLNKKTKSVQYVPKVVSLCFQISTQSRTSLTIVKYTYLILIVIYQYLNYFTFPISFLRSFLLYLRNPKSTANDSKMVLSWICFLSKEKIIFQIGLQMSKFWDNKGKKHTTKLRTFFLNLSRLIR